MTDSTAVGGPDVERSQLEHSARLHWFHWAILAMSLLVTFGAYQYSKRQVQARNEQQFDREAMQAIDLVRERMEKYEDALRGGVAFYRANNESIAHAEWLAYSQSLNIELRYPGINGIGVINALDLDEVDDFVASQREVRPDFTIYPPHGEDVSWPITYIEPVATNGAAVGLDMAHESNRFDAAKKARDTATSQITGPIELVQFEDKAPGFLFFAPFYAQEGTPVPESREAQFRGMVYAPFVVHRLMEGVLDKQNRHVGIRLTDDASVIYDELVTTESDFDPDPMFKNAITVPMYGREWNFDIWSARSFRVAQGDSQSILILIGGALVDVLLLGVFLLLTRGNRRALNLADAATATLRERNEELKTSRERFSQVITGSNDGFWDWDTGNDMWFSDRFEKLLRLSPGALSQTFAEYESRVHADDREVFDDAIRAHLNSQTPFDIEHRLLLADGSYRWFRTRGQATWDDNGNPTRMSGSIIDLHDRRVAEERLRENEAILSDKNRELEQFVYTASHDLKSPIVTILGFSSHVLMDVKAGRFDEVEAFVTRIARAGERMQASVADLLEVSRIGRVNTERRNVDLALLATEVWGVLSDQHPERLTLVQSFAPSSISINVVQARQIVENLLENAVRYGCKGGAGEVEIGTQSTDEFVSIFVRDHGPGIAVEHRERVLGLFQRLSPDKEGTGIGLAIVKRIAEVNGGRVEIDETPGGGTTFWIHLPTSTHVATDDVASLRC